MKPLLPSASSHPPASLGWIWGILFLLIFSACISTATAQSPTNKPKRLATNLKAFGIPFRINASDESFIEVQLYLSTDQGDSWRFVDRQSTDKNEFPFQAQNDGEYWFAIKTLNRNRQLIPEGKPNVELIIQVDTVLPELVFDAKADAAGRIECNWKASDKNLKPDSLQLAYQPIGAAPEDWKVVAVNLTGSARNGSYADQIAWWPDTADQSLNVRVSIADQAGNTVYHERRINIAQSPWRHRTQSTARTGDANSSGQILSAPAPVDNQPAPALPFPENTDAHTQKSLPRTSSDNAPADSHQQTKCENGVCSIAAQPTDSQSSLPPNPAWRVAGGSKSGHEAPLVGSPPVVSEPPNPDLYGAIADNRMNPAYGAGSNHRPAPALSGSVAWESTTERWTQQSQSSSSTVRSPPINQNLAPNYPENRRDDSALPNPNPNRITHGDHTVMGESSTSAPNQYQGLPQQSSPIAAPEFLAGEESDNWVGSDESVAPSQNIFQQSNQFNTPQASTSQPFDPNSHTSGNPTYQPNSQIANLSSYGARRDDPESVMDQPVPLDASLQMIPSKRFRLNYSIDAIDPSGVARVDLWMTRDGGRTWKTWGTDPDNRSPFPVEVDEEGGYGFRIVIHSKDGLTGRAPSNGDKPDIFVQVDTQAPLAQIVSVPYGRSEEAGRLIINYRVTDPHLPVRPISLYYSPAPNGPWTPIEEGLRNEGRYVWKPASNVPDRIFLRLDAVDRATNKGSHALNQAIDVSGLVPRGTIQGVVPVGGN